jgi:hypothetical protein
MDDFSVYLLVVVEISEFVEEVDFIFAGGREMLHLEDHVAAFEFCFLLVNNDRFLFQLLGYFLEFRLDLQDRPFLDEGLLIEILHEELRHDVEVFLIVSEQNLDLIEDLAHILQLKLVFLNKPHYFQNLLLHDLILTDRFFVPFFVQILEVLLEGIDEIFEFLALFGGDAAIFAPIIAFFLESFEIFLKEGLVIRAEVVVIIGETFFGAFHGVEGFTVVVKFEEADAHVGESEGIGRAMFDCHLVVFDGLFVVRLSLVDVRQIVVRKTVTWVHFYRLLVPIDSFLDHILPLVDNSCIVVRRMVVGIRFDSLLVRLDCFLILLAVIIADAHRIVKHVHLLLELLGAVLSHEVVFYGFVVFTLVVVCQSGIVVIVVSQYAVLVHQLADLVVVVLEVGVYV